MRYFYMVILCLTLATPAMAMDWLGARGPAFVKSLQQLVSKDQKAEIAELVSYPLSVDGNDSINDQATFVQAYDSIFTKAVKECLAQEDTSRNMESVDGSYMIGWGCVWFDEVLPDDAPDDAKGKVSILSVNTQAP